MADRLTVDEFANRVKAKYPDYAAIDNRELAQKMIAKYPEYKDVIVFAPQVKIDPKNLVASPPQESTLGSRAREAAIGVLSPFTIPALAETAKTIGGAAYDVAKQVTLPAVAKVVSGDTSDLQKTAGELKDLASGFFHSAVDQLEQATGTRHRSHQDRYSARRLRQWQGPLIPSAARCLTWAS